MWNNKKICSIIKILFINYWNDSIIKELDNYFNICYI